jgi:beta-glucosidase
VTYSLQISRDGKSWGTAIAQGPGATPTTAISFRPVTAKFIRITQTGTSATQLWAVQRIRVYVAGRQ